MRAWQLARQPLCDACSAAGVVTLATVADHRMPIKRGGERMEPENLQSLCRRCHNRKTAAEARGGAG